jgi:hypothetical protein
MGRIYSASFTGVSVAAAQDLFEINAPADAVVAIHSIIIGQSSDYGDSEAEGLQIQISRSTGTSGSGGSTLTPVAHEGGDAAFGGTVEANNTTQATTTTVIHSDTFNIQAGWQFRPTPEERIYISPSARVVVELPGAPTDAVTMSGTIVIEEIGG